MALIKLNNRSSGDNAIHGRRNLIINGAMQCWQRGTSSTTHGFGSADRWFHYTTSTGFTFSQSTDAPEGFTYSLTTTGTPSGEYNITQGIELPAANEAGQLFNGQKITVSYYAKSSVAGDRVWNMLIFRTNSVSSSGQVVVDFDNTDNNLLSTSWQRFTKTYTIGVDPANNCNQLAFAIRSRNNANTSSTPAGNISVTGVQIELGDKVTPFEHRSFGEELLLCQRYYVQMCDNTSQSSIAYGRGAGSGQNAVCAAPIPVPLRASPTVTTSGTYHVSDSNSRVSATPTSITPSGFNPLSTNLGLYFAFGTTVCDDDRVCLVGGNGAVTIGIDAEL